MPAARVVIVMPTDRPVPVETMSSFGSVLVRGWAAGLCVGFITQADTYLDWARNALVAQALEHPADPTHLLWMDSDMVLPGDVIADLLAHEVDVVGALYHQRKPPFLPVAYDLDSEPFGLLDDVEVDALQVVGGLGLGATLVAIDVYRRMEEHFGDVWWHRVTEGEGEDVWFFRRLRDLGIPAHLDGAVQCGHIGRQVVTTAHWQAYRSLPSHQGAGTLTPPPG